MPLHFKGLNKHLRGCEAQLAWKSLFTPIFSVAILTHSVGQTDLVLVCDQGSLVGLCMQDYKSLRVAVTICATVVNIQTDTQTARHTDTQRDILARLYE